eukprot:COSAG06_NODE_31553_length_519_cov_1.983333_1_plen_86_part_00
MCETMAVQAPNRAAGDPEPPESAFFRGEHHRRFPYNSPDLNDMCLHPRFMRCEKRSFRPLFNIKHDRLPRQARDKHSEKKVEREK